MVMVKKDRLCLECIPFPGDETGTAWLLLGPPSLAGLELMDRAPVCGSARTSCTQRAVFSKETLLGRFLAHQPALAAAVEAVTLDLCFAFLDDIVLAGTVSKLPPPSQPPKVWNWNLLSPRSSCPTTLPARTCALSRMSSCGKQASSSSSECQFGV